MPSRDPSLLDARLLLFTGKGGVGKTSVVAATALQAAARGRRPLVVELGHRASMESLFDAGSIGHEPRDVGRGVHAINLDFETSLHEYLVAHVKIGRVVRAMTRNQALMRFFQAAPSVGEVVTLNKLAALEAERDGAGPRWDPILVDLDATGHAVMLLNTPRVMDGLIGQGPMRGLIDGFSKLLSDPRRTCLSLVTLPRELPAQETLELYRELKSKHAVPLGKLIVNQFPASPLAPELDAHFEAFAARAHQSDDPVLARALVVSERARQRHARARDQLELLREQVELPLVRLPDLEGGIDLDALVGLGETILDAGSKDGGEA